MTTIRCTNEVSALRSYCCNTQGASPISTAILTCRGYCGGPLQLQSAGPRVLYGRSAMAMDALLLKRIVSRLGGCTHSSYIRRRCSCGVDVVLVKAALCFKKYTQSPFREPRGAAVSDAAAAGRLGCLRHYGREHRQTQTPSRQRCMPKQPFTFQR